MSFYIYTGLVVCAFLNYIFDEFLNIEPILVKIGVKWPHKKRQFLKKFPTDFDQIWSFDVKLMQNKVHQILCRYLQLFWSYSGKTRRGHILRYSTGRGLNDCFSCYELIVPCWHDPSIPYASFFILIPYCAFAFDIDYGWFFPDFCPTLKGIYSTSKNMYFLISFKKDFGLNWSECKINIY